MQIPPGVLWGIRFSMSQADTFVREIAAHPEDDGPRLVFADWLDERGDERGEFIRVQCELHGMAPRDPRRPELESRQLRLWRRNSKGWAGPLRKFTKRWTFRRGMVESIQIDAERFLQNQDELFATAPILEVDFRNAVPLLSQIADSESLSHLSGVGFPQNGIARGGTGDWRLPYDNNWRTYAERQSQHTEELRSSNLPGILKIIRSPHVKELQRLNLDFNFIGDAGARIVATSPELESLRSLSLRGSLLHDEGGAAIVDSPHLKNLQDVAFGSCHNVSHNYTGDTAGSFAEAIARFLGRVESLSLAQCGITLASIQFFGESNAEQLRRLDLGGSMLFPNIYGDDTPGFEVFAPSGLLTNLDELNLMSCYIDASSLRRLSKTDGFCRLVKLDLSNDELSAASGTVLAKLPMNELTHLTLNGRMESGANLGNAGVAKMLDSENMKRLSVLSLRRQLLTPKVASNLVESPITRQLYHLDLSHNKIGNKGADLLASMGPWDRLAVLNLFDNRIGKPAKLRLIKAFGDRVIV